MKLSNNTVLITGGSSGIGLELCRVLVKMNNKVIICGRSEQKLVEAKKVCPQAVTFQCDLSTPDECQRLASWLFKEHPGLNLLINNAAIVHRTEFIEDEEILEKSEAEISTNLLAPIRLIKLLYPLLSSNTNPAIINVTTGLVYAPKATYPLYNATKSALHSFTQVLRIQLQGKGIRIIEAMFPAVDTPWHEGNPPRIAIAPEKAVDKMIKGLMKGKDEIKIARVKVLYHLSRIAPEFALRKINSIS
jgi:uncharacterized oxidoreductase